MSKVNGHLLHPPAVEKTEIDALYIEFLSAFYDNRDREHAGKIARRLEKALNASPELSASIRGEEIRSLIAELRKDYDTAIRSREAEIRKILELHNLTQNTPSWEYVERQYSFADVSDRLDLLATLYDEQGNTDRAIATLRESQQYCLARQIPYDGQDLLDEFGQRQASTAIGSSHASKRGAKSRSIPGLKRKLLTK